MNIELLQKGNAKVCEKILRSLPNWFGIESAIQDYVTKSAAHPMIVAYSNSQAIGFLSLKEHTPHCSEIYVMGIAPDNQRQGIGKKLIEEAEKTLKEKNIAFLQVKTLSEGREDPFYRQTRLFYKSQGFKEIEVFPTLWDKANPCLLLLKAIMM